MAASKVTKGSLTGGIMGHISWASLTLPRAESTTRRKGVGDETTKEVAERRAQSRKMTNELFMSIGGIKRMESKPFRRNQERALWNAEKVLDGR